MANNTVNITNSNNTVTITPQDNNTLNTETTTTSVSVTQGSTSVVTVNTPGPRGIQGEGANIDTGSLVTTSSFSTFTASIQTEVDSLTAATSSYITEATDISSLNTFTGSIQTEVDNLTSATSSYITSIPAGTVSSSEQITITEDQISDLSHTNISSLNTFTGSIQTEVDTLTASTSSYLTEATLPSTFPYTGSATISGSLNVIGDITASNSIQIGPNTAALFGRSDRSSLAVGRTPYFYAGNNAFQADLFYTYNGGGASNPALYIGKNGGGAGRGIYADNGGLRFSSNNSTTFYFNGAANTGTYGPSIGIGTDPVANLDIKTLRTPYDYFRISGSSGLSVETDLSASAETFMISKSGDVGIGTWSPTHKLTVVGSVSASAFIGDGSTLDNIVGLPHSGSLLTSGGIVTLNTADYAFRDSSQVPAHRVKTREGIYVGSNGDSESSFGMYYGYNQIKYNNGYSRPTLSFSSNGITLNGSFTGDTVRGTNGLQVGGGNGKEIGVTGGNDLNVTFTGQFGAALTSGQSYIQLHGPNHNPNKGKLIIAAGNNSQHGHIQFYTTGSERMRITHSGSVGIGVTDPQTNLHVSGTVSASSFSGDGSGLTGISVFPFTGSAIISSSLEVIGSNITSGSLDIIGSGSNPLNTILSVENPFSSQTNLFNIGEKGDIAFQGSPVSSRTISSTYPEIKLWNGQGIIGFDGGSFVLRAGKRFAIQHHPGYTEGVRFGTFGGSYYAGFYNQKFGIGTTTPSEKLTVEGNISASAYLGSVTNITPPNTTTTASLDCSLSNFFTLTLSSSNNIHLTSSNITAGQSINLRIIQPATSGSLTYDDTFKFPNGAPYEVSATHSVEDIVSFISFDSSTLYGSSLKNFE